MRQATSLSDRTTTAPPASTQRRCVLVFLVETRIHDRRVLPEDLLGQEVSASVGVVMDLLGSPPWCDSYHSA